MAYSYLTQVFTDGMNQDMSPVAIDLSMEQSTVKLVQSATNFLFERGLAVTRPGLSTFSGPPTSLPTTSDLLAVQSLNSLAHAQNSPTTSRMAIAIIGNGTACRLYTLEGNGSAGTILEPTEITGAGFNLPVPTAYACTAIVNGVIMIGGNFTGLVRVSPSANTYTIVASSPYQYVTGHQARAVAAYDLSLLNGPTKVAWSVQGDETNWTGVGSGSAFLADVTDSITGLKVVKGLVLVARSYGFHVGIPTGIFPAVYDWRKQDDLSIGVMHPASLVVYKNVLFFMSESGIHTYDLVNVEDIGEGIHSELVGFIQQSGVVVRGFISAGYKSDYQPTYNLIIDSQQSRTSSPDTIFPHYMYNIRERKWTRHLYAAGAQATAWTAMPFSISYRPSFALTHAPTTPRMSLYTRKAGAAPVPKFWNTNASTVESDATITTGMITLQNPTMDVGLNRLMLIYNAAASAAGASITFTITSILNGVTSTTTTSITTYPAGGWDRRWINVRMTGNMFKVVIKLTAATLAKLELKALILEFSDSGGVRV